jgi:hypothetical protein
MTRKQLMELHDELCRKAYNTMERKNHDYTSNAPDPFANFRGSEFLGIHPVLGILLRVQDKIKRIQSYIEQGELKVQGEGVEDAIQDTINYMILACGIIRSQEMGVDKHVTSDTDISTDREEDYRYKDPRRFPFKAEALDDPPN